MPALVRVASLGPFFNTLAVDDKYSRRNMQNFQQQLQSHYLKNNLSKKKVSLLVSVFRFFLQRLAFIAFLKPVSNLQPFEKKGESPSFSISEIIEVVT